MWRQVASLFLSESGNPQGIFRRVALVLALLGLAWSLALAGVVAAVWGSIRLFSMWLPTWGAVLTTGGVLLALALIALYARRQKQQKESLAKPAEAIVARFPMESVALAAAAGFAFACFPEVRTLVFKQLGAR